MYLTSLEIANLRAIESLALNFRRIDESADARRWTVLLGENGCGKSTILKAIGLLLAGSEALPDLLGETDQWVRNGADRATVRGVIRTSQGKERHVELEIRRGERRDQVLKRNTRGLKELDAALDHADRNYFIAGYGAFRRPPSTEFRHSRGGGGIGRAAHLQTLFSTSSELMSLEAWAMDLDYSSEGSARNVIADALGKLLPGMSFKTIDKRSRQVVMDTSDGDVPLGNLSEGYQAMAAWAGDLLFRMTQTFRDRQNPLEARGVLLIDEMDLHLHPRWKRQLVDFINEAFPNLQIVATTHSPLSVQQCGEGELFVVQRRDGKPSLLPFTGDPSKLRLSDLFLSPLIGLETLDSPRIAALRDKARAIELKAGPTSDEDAIHLRELNAELKSAMPLAIAEAPALEDFIKRSQTHYGSDLALRIADAKLLFGGGEATPAQTGATAKPAKKVSVKKAAKTSPSKKYVMKSPAKERTAPKTPAGRKAAAKKS